MSSLLWTLAVYAGTVLIAWRLRLVKLRTVEDRRVLLAILLVLAGAHSTAVRTGAEDVAANPVVIETAMRGLLDLLALLVVVPLLPRADWRRTVGDNLGAMFLIAYLAVAGISTLYSVAPIVTAGKAFELAVGLIVILTAVGMEPGGATGRVQSFVRTVVLFEAGLLITALAGFFLMPQTFSLVEARPGFFLPQILTSPYAHSNGLSSMGALVSAYGFAEFWAAEAGQARRLWLGLGVLGAICAALASGRQGAVIWIASMAVLLWVCKRRWFLILVAPTAVALAVAYRDVLLAVLSRGQASVTLATWSGRLEFWDAALEVWEQHPWLGYGFGAGGRFVALESIGEDAVGSLHSGYMEALTGVGIVGVVPLGLAIALMVVWAIRCLRARRLVSMAILVIPLLIRTFVSTGFGGWLNGEFLIFAALVLVAREHRRRRWIRPGSGLPESRKLVEQRRP